MTRAAILDVDGLLIDSNDAHARAWLEALADRRVAVPFGVICGCDRTSQS